MNADRRRALDEFSRLRNTRGGRIYEGRNSRKDMRTVVRRNAYDIISLQRRINDDVRSVLELSTEDSDAREALLTDVMRRLHNFLASAVSLEQQTMRHTRTFYRNRALLREYDERCDHIMHRAPVICVTRELRDAAVHFSLPSVLAGFTIRGSAAAATQDQESNMSLSLLIDKASAMALLAANRRRSRRRSLCFQLAKSFLEADEDDLPLVDLVENYIDAIDPLYDWLDASERTEEWPAIQRFIGDWNRTVNIYNKSLSLPAR